MSDQPAYQIRTLPQIGDINAADWNACANPAGRAFNPFVSHAFLSAVEQSGSAAPETGWSPLHLVLETDTGKVLGCAPGYAKSHSQGEYVFDHSWAHAFERAGGDYYPKLQVAVPFTPATGPRLLVKEDDQAHQHRLMLAKGLTQVTDKFGLSSAHITFAGNDDISALADSGYLIRHDQQFHWHNDGYENFDDFLAALSSRKRKNIRKERDGAVSSGLHVEIVTGSDLTEAHWDAFYQFYIDTGYRKWGSPYLTRSFFSIIGETMPDDVALVLAKRDDTYIAGAINFIGEDTLYGRNWGAIEHHKFLHFEVCYYQAIQFAIERGLKRVEAGAQGAHKLARGYVPSITRSAHYIAHEGFREAVGDFLEQERRAVDEDQTHLARHAPFRKDRYRFEPTDSKAIQTDGDF